MRLSAGETTDELTHHDYPVLTEKGIYESESMPDKTIDYIFTFGKSHITPEKFDIITTQKALASSDHCPLIGVFEI